VVGGLDVMSSFLPKSLNAKYQVILVVDCLETGGAESQVVMLAKGLVRRGIHCLVFALRAEGPFLDELLLHKIKVVNAGFPRGRDRPAFVKGMLRLCRLVFNSRPCVVHTFLPLSNFVGSLAGYFSGASVVVTSRRGLGVYQETSAIWKYYDRISNALSNTISVNSLAVAHDVIKRDGAHPGKVVCIYNGLDFSRFEFPPNLRKLMRNQLGLLESDFAWIKVANLASYKGHLDLLEALSTLSRRRNVRLFLVGGDLGMRAQLEGVSARLGLNKQVIFLGSRLDVPEILSAMDGCVMASHTEGFSNAILEAMAAGLPIVATNVGGNTEALQGGALGVLVDSNCPVALGSAMHAIMGSLELRNRLSVSGALAVRECYGVDTMIDSYVCLYASHLE